MELRGPSITEGYQRCVERGATRVMLIPCFLSRGRHVAEDIPAQVAAAAAQFPHVHYQISPPLLELEGFIEMLAAFVEASA
jgi:sirohydrochlorin ferrochelatase